MSRPTVSRVPQFAAACAAGAGAGVVAAYLAAYAAVLGTAGLQAQEIVDLSGEDRPVSAELELVYRLGSAGATVEWQEFTSISGIAFDGASNLYLLDGTRMESSVRIVVVDPTGRFVREFGRAGDGPGEFGAATQLVVWEDVEDRALVEAWAPVEDDGPRSGALEDTIDEEWGFEPDLLFDALPSGGVAFSDSSAWAIKLTDASGEIARILRRPIRPLTVTDAMKSVERERRLEEESGRTVTQLGGPPPPRVLAMISDYRAAQREAIEDMQFFPEVPVTAALRATWDGALWVQRSTEPGSDEPGPIDVIASDGRYVATLATGTTTLPDMPDAFGPDGLVAFIGADEFDVPVITVSRLPPGIR